MKKLFLLLSFLIPAMAGFCQYPVTQNLGNSSTLVQVPANGALRAGLINRSYTDTTAANASNIKYYPASFIFTTTDSSLWFRNKNATAWVLLGATSGGATGVFWNLTGNYLSVTPSGFGIGTNSADNLPFKTSGVTRMILPSTGLSYSNVSTDSLLARDISGNLVLVPKSTGNGYLFRYSTTESGGNVNLVNDLSSPYGNFNYATNQNAQRGWRLNSYNNLFSKPDSINVKSDTVTLVQQPTNTIFPTNVWLKNSNWTGFTTETAVSGGLRINSTLNSGVSGNSTIKDTAWESCINNKTGSISFKLESTVSSNAFIGHLFFGATNIFSVSRLAYINVTTGSCTLLTYTGTHALGSFTSISTNDSVKFSMNENFDTYTIRLINYTTGRDESLVYFEAGGTGTSPVTDIYPGLLVQGCSILMGDYRYYANNYQPDFMFLGSSITQNEKGNTLGYSASFGGYLDSVSNATIEIAAKSANELEDMIQCLKEIVAMKPKTVIIEGGYNNNQSRGQSPTVWGLVYRRLVDSLLNHGIKVVVERIIPASNGTPQTVNTWIDTTYTNNQKVQILNLWNTTLMYDAANPPYYNNTSYYVDGIHPNSAGGNQMAQYTKTQLERFFRNNFGSGADFTLTNRRDNQLPLYDSSGINQGAWSSYRLGSTFTVEGDSINVNNSFMIVANYDQTGLTSTTSNAINYTTPNDGNIHIYDIGCHLTVTAVGGGGVLTTTVTYFDETNTSRTVTFYSMGSTSAGLTTTGVSNFPVMGEITAYPNTAITLTTTLTVGTATYNLSADLRHIRRGLGL